MDMMPLLIGSVRGLAQPNPPMVRSAAAASVANDTNILRRGTRSTRSMVVIGENTEMPLRMSVALKGLKPPTSLKKIVPYDDTRAIPDICVKKAAQSTSPVRCYVSNDKPIFMNNDTRSGPQWISHLIDAMEKITPRSRRLRRPSFLKGLLQQVCLRLGVVLIVTAVQPLQRRGCFNETPLPQQPARALRQQRAQRDDDARKHHGDYQRDAPRPIVLEVAREAHDDATDEGTEYAVQSVQRHHHASDGSRHDFRLREREQPDRHAGSRVVGHAAGKLLPEGGGGVGSDEACEVGELHEDQHAPTSVQFAYACRNEEEYGVGEKWKRVQERELCCCDFPFLFR